MNNSHPQRPGRQEAIDATAAAWLARADKELSAEEQAEFALWRFSDPRHAEAVARLENAWGALDALRDFRPEAATHPDSELLAPATAGSKVVRFPAWTGALAAAALVMIGLFIWQRATVPQLEQAPRQAIIHPGPERITLDDGSTVELNAGAKIEANFTADERRVQLVRGEAHFNVAKNPARPFIVEGGKVSVRAVGTAFSVALAQDEVAVLVTEGTVRVTTALDATATSVVLTTLTVGQRVVIETTAAASVEIMPVVENVTPAQMERALAWQAMRLEFVAMPLGDVATEFNRYNRQRLVVRDSATAEIVVEGNFRADNVEGFARLLEASFGVEVVRLGDELHLRKAP